MNRGESIRLMHPLFHEGEGGSTPTSPLQMRIELISWEMAKDLNKLWHSRLPRIGDPAGATHAWLCFAAENKGVAYAVAIWSHPVNRNLPQDEWLELRRLAIAPDAPKNTATWMLKVMRFMIRKKRPQVKRLVSYQDMSVHAGTIYAAAGWERTVVKRFSSWTSKTRNRPTDQSNGDKQRWEKTI